MLLLKLETTVYAKYIYIYVVTRRLFESKENIVSDITLYLLH